MSFRGAKTVAATANDSKPAREKEKTVKIFNWDKKDEAKFDEALSQPLPPEPKPITLYKVIIVTETESIPSLPMPLNQAQQHGSHMAIYGAYITRGEEPLRHIPPHRIYEIVFEREGAAK